MYAAMRCADKACTGAGTHYVMVYDPIREVFCWARLRARSVMTIACGCVSSHGHMVAMSTGVAVPMFSAGARLTVASDASRLLAVASDASRCTGSSGIEEATRIDEGANGHTAR